MPLNFQRLLQPKFITNNLHERCSEGSSNFTNKTQTRRTKTWPMYSLIDGPGCGGRDDGGMGGGDVVSCHPCRRHGFLLNVVA